MSTNYLEALAEDFTAIGFPQDKLTPTSYESCDLIDLQVQLDRTRNIGRLPLESLANKQLDLRTDLAKTALSLIREASPPVIFDNSCLLVGCTDAERKLINNIDGLSVDCEDYASPIVVTKGDAPDDPVGIIKGCGEETCYGLATDIAKGLVQGTFSEPTFRKFIELWPKSNHPWYLPLDKIRMFAPLRFGTFIVPAEGRTPLLPNTPFAAERQVLQTDHSQIQQRALELLAEAKPLAEVIIMSDY